MPSAVTVSLAFAASPHPWQQEWLRQVHSHSTDARVVAVIADQRDLFEEKWQVLVIDAVSLWLTTGFVDEVHARRRGILVVYDPDDQRAKRRAMGVGADVPLVWHASPAELIRTAQTLSRLYPSAAPPAPRPQPTQRPPGGRVIAVGGPPGADPERVAVALAAALARRGDRVVLLDANEVDPCLAQRLDLHPLPNLAAAANRLTGDVRDDLQEVPTGRFWALPGLADPAQWSSTPPKAVRKVARLLADHHQFVVAVVGPLVEDSARYGLTLAVLTAADVVIPTGEAAPDGLAALTTWTAGAVEVARNASFYPTAVYADVGRKERADVEELLAKVAALVPGGGSVSLLPAATKRENRARWNGTVSVPRKLNRSIERLARAVHVREVSR